jgi:hypothetical protein
VQIDAKPGLNRLFWVLTFAWVLVSTVAYPLHLQLERQIEVDSLHQKEVVSCSQNYTDFRESEACYNRAQQDWQNGLALASFKNFWIWDAAFWKLLVPAIISPPLAIYCFALLSRWIYRGFKSPSNPEGL